MLAAQTPVVVVVKLSSSEAAEPVLLSQPSSRAEAPSKTAAAYVRGSC